MTRTLAKWLIGITFMVCAMLIGIFSLLGNQSVFYIILIAGFVIWLILMHFLCCPKCKRRQGRYGWISDQYCPHCGASLDDEIV